MFSLLKEEKRTMKYLMKTTTLVMMMLTVISHGYPQRAPDLFVKELENVRQSLKIPGMYIALKIGDSMVVDTGLGWADIEKKVKVSNTTTFRIASVTKTFTSTILLQLVEKKLINLDTPVSYYGIDLGNPKITIRHLFNHTSEGEPGTWYHYNGYRFGFLTSVIEQASGKPFYRLITEQILEPLQMKNSAPGISLAEYISYINDDSAVTEFFNNASSHLATPYAIDKAGNVIIAKYLNEFGAFGGMMSNAHDLLKYSAAIDQHTLLTARMQKQAFTHASLVNGNKSPYGLGWFCQKVDGLNYYWHYGQSPGEGAFFFEDS